MREIEELTILLFNLLPFGGEEKAQREREACESFVWMKPLGIFFI